MTHDAVTVGFHEPGVGVSSRAAVRSGPRSLAIRELTVPEAPPTGGAIIRVAANGVCGSDWDVYDGRLANPGGRLAPFPMVIGHEPVGSIVAIHPTARDAWGVGEGDRIVVESKVRCGSCGACLNGTPFLCSRSVVYSLMPIDEGAGLWGGMAEYMVLRPMSAVFKVPDQLSDIDATLFNPWGNAFHWTVEVGQVGVADRVLVLGCGQRGLACSAAAREAGASQVIVTGLGRDAHKLALAPRFGASDVIDVEREDTVVAVRDRTEGKGVDIVVDTVPEATAPLVHAVEVLRGGGRLVIAGVRSEPLALPVEQFRTKQLRMTGVSGTSTWAVSNAIRVLASGRYPLQELHTHTLPLDDAERAIRLLGGDVEGEEPVHVAVVP